MLTSSFSLRMPPMLPSRIESGGFVRNACRRQLRAQLEGSGDLRIGLLLQRDHVADVIEVPVRDQDELQLLDFVEANVFSSGITPASDSFLALTITMTFIALFSGV
jgi:hypothetical protein